MIGNAHSIEDRQSTNNVNSQVEKKQQRPERIAPAGSAARPRHTKKKKPVDQPQPQTRDIQHIADNASRVYHPTSSSKTSLKSAKKKATAVVKRKHPKRDSQKGPGKQQTQPKRAPHITADKSASSITRTKRTASNSTKQAGSNKHVKNSTRQQKTSKSPLLPENPPGNNTPLKSTKSTPTRDIQHAQPPVPASTAPLIGSWLASGEPFKILKSHTKRTNTTGKWIHHGNIVILEGANQIQLHTLSSKYILRLQGDPDVIIWHKIAHGTTDEVTKKLIWEPVDGILLQWVRA